MSYLLNTNSSVQVYSASRSLSTLLSFSLSAVEVEQVVTLSISLSAQEITLPFTEIRRLALIGISATQPVSLALIDNDGVAAYSMTPAEFTLHVFSTQLIIDFIKLRSNANATVELVLAGNS